MLVTAYIYFLMPKFKHYLTMHGLDHSLSVFVVVVVAFNTAQKV